MALQLPSLLELGHAGGLVDFHLGVFDHEGWNLTKPSPAELLPLVKVVDTHIQRRKNSALSDHHWLL